MPLLQPQPGKTEGGLSTPSVLLGQIDGKLVQYLASAALHGPVEAAVTVHDDESECLVVHEEFVEVLGVEFVVAEVEGGVDGFEGFKVDVNLAFFAFVGDYRSAVEDQSILPFFIWAIHENGLISRREMTSESHTQTARQHEKLTLGHLL